MALTITPQEDFGKIDTPTKETLERQARSLQFAGISAANLAAGILTIFSGDDSDTSGSSLTLGSDTGQLWIDPHGNLWIREASGDVKLYRHDMGWDSHRNWIQIDVGYGAVDPRPGAPVTINGTQGTTEAYLRSVNETTQTNSLIMDVEQVSLLDNQNQVQVGVLQETGSSGYRSYNGRGGVSFFGPDFSQSAVASYDRDIKNNFRLLTNSGFPGVIVYEPKFMSNDFDANLSRYIGIACSPNASTSAVSDANFDTNGFRNFVAIQGYNFGLPLMGEQTQGGVNP